MCFKSQIYIVILVLFITANVSYPVLSDRYANDFYNWIFISITIVFIIGTIIYFYFSLYPGKAGVYVSRFSLIILSLLIPLSIAFAWSILLITDKNVIGTGFIYYNIRGAEIIKETGYITSLKFIKTFDNFISSPGLPIFGSILSMITSLTFTHFVTFGWVLFYALVLLIIYIIINSLKIKTFSSSVLPIYILIFITVISLISVLPPFLNYNMMVLPLLILLEYLLVKITLSMRNIVENVVSFLITLSASALYYLPGVIMFAIIIFSSLSFVHFFAEKKLHIKNIPKRTSVLKWIILSSVLLIILYVVYLGYFFYEDFSYFVYIILKNLKPAPFIVVTGLREQILDSSMRFALYLSRVKIMGLLIIMIASFLSFFNDRSFIRWLGLSSLLFTGLKLISYFVHAVTDYVVRFDIYLALLIPIPLFVFFDESGKVNITALLKRLTRRFSLREHQLIYVKSFLFTICLIGFVFSLLYSLLLISPTPKLASDDRYYMYDSWMVSRFVGESLEASSGIDIIGNHRYAYIQSLYDLKIYELSSEFLKNLDSLYSRGSWLLVLSSLSLKIPDRNCEPLSQVIVEDLDSNTILIYNSYYSFVFYNRI